MPGHGMILLIYQHTQNCTSWNSC